MTNTLHRRALLGSSAAVAAAMTLTPASRASAQTTPPSPMPPVEAFGIRLVDQIDLSPDGKRVAAVTQNGDDKFLVAFDIADMKPTTKVIGKEKVRNVLWADNESVVLVDSVTMSLPLFGPHVQEFTEARRVNMTTSEVMTFFAHQNNGSAQTGSVMARKEALYYPIIMGNLVRVKVNGKYQVTASNYRVLDEYDLCLFSFANDSDVGTMIAEGSHYTNGFVVTPEGEVAAFSTFDDFRKTWTLAYNTTLGTGHRKFQTVYTANNQALHAPEIVCLGRDGTSIVIRLRDGDNYYYHEIGADGVLGPVLNTDFSGESLFALTHPTTFRLAGFGRDEDTYVYNYFDPLLKKLHDSVPQVIGEGYRFYPVAYAEDPRKMLVFSEGADDAGSYYFIDFTTGAATTVASNYPGLPTEWIAQKQVVTYKAADGLTIHAMLTLPPFHDGKNLPLIVMPHGGPEAHDDIDFDWQSQCLASRGYAVLQPNFRGSTGYGQAFVDAGHGEWGRKMQTDLSDGVRWLAGQGIVDPKRVAILGASYGGYAALAGATLDPGIYNCAVSIAGVADLASMVDWEADNSDNLGSEDILYWKQFMGPASGWDDVSPAKQAAKASCPVLLIHGTDDTVVPIGQSRRMESALKSAGKTVEFVTYAGQDHWETVGSSAIAMMKAALTFLAKYNPA